MVINDLVSKLTVYGLALVTITTSSAAGYKLVTYHPAVNSTVNSNLTQNEDFNSQFLNPNQDDNPDNNTESLLSEIFGSPQNPKSGNGNSTGLIFPTLKPVPTISGQISSTNNLTSSNSTSCIVTLWGQQYDVTNLRNTHSGGNIFNCGTDMTSTYQGQHGTNLSRMLGYKVTTSSSSSPTPTITPSNQSPTATPLPQTGNNNCVVTLWGIQYNVTNLRNTHSGGNIFNCGTDMTSIYQNQHGTNVTRMQSYRISTSSPTSTPRPTTPPSQSPTATPTPIPGNNSCIVTLWNIQYDVTNLRNTHSGGNIFNCGTDMTSIYQGRHGTNVSRMQSYRITTPTSVPGTTPQPTPIVPTSVPSGQSLPPAVAALYPGATIRSQSIEDNGSIEMEINYNGSCRHIKVNSSGDITSNQSC